MGVAATHGRQAEADSVGAGRKNDHMGGRHLTDDTELVDRVHAMRASGATYVQIKAELGIGASAISRILGVYGKGHAKSRVTEDLKQRARTAQRRSIGARNRR